MLKKVESMADCRIQKFLRLRALNAVLGDLLDKI